MSAIRILMASGAPFVPNVSIGVTAGSTVNTPIAGQGEIDSYAVVAPLPAHGAASFIGNVLSFAATPGYSGADTVNYKAVGPNGDSNTGVGSVSITAAPSLTVALDPSGATTGSTNGSIGFSASVSGGAGPFTYDWAAEGNGNATVWLTGVSGNTATLNWSGFLLGGINIAVVASNGTLSGRAEALVGHT